MIKIAICDDHPDKTAQIESLLHNLWKNQFPDYRCKLDIEVFFSGTSLINSLSTDYYDLILLDIEMGKVSGIDAATYLRDTVGNSDSQIIYISAYESYVLKLFDTIPSGFIKKPIDIAEFTEKISKTFIRILAEKSTSDRGKIQIVTKGELYQVDKKDIIYFESKGRKISLFTVDKRNKPISFYAKLNEYQQNPILEGFIRIHQSYLVNLKHIVSVRPTELTCSNMDVLPISNRYRKETHENYLNYRGKIYG